VFFYERLEHKKVFHRPQFGETAVSCDTSCEAICAFSAPTEESMFCVPRTKTNVLFEMQTLARLRLENIRISFLALASKYICHSLAYEFFWLGL